ncbi:MAG: GntR family transcriptional regulator [Alphaproteobacteria bacterium]|jgi:DNA-binding GntR family transcriptional regulator|nr:GntR family transcriptional regulator [Alphaproteobacteria bacterium]MDP6517945.1 GntR family transcriptional regulator [Alphaproteobacteria bacterium]
MNNMQDIAADGQPKLNRIAYREIEELIVTLQLAPGAVLSEADLAGRLGISRTPVREALQRLAREGLVRIMPRRGLLVTEVNIEKQLRMLEVRREIERFLARHAAKRRIETEQRQFLVIAEALAETGKTGDEVAFTRADGDLNIAVARAARNEFAVEAIGLMQGLSRRFWHMFHGECGDVTTAAALHRRLALAIADGDPESAAAASDTLLDYVEAFTRASLGVSPRAAHPAA